MAREKYTNNAVSPLDGAINNSTTSVVVDDGTAFPTANFRIICEDEIMFCSSRSGDTLTVVRGTEGTTAASHADDKDVEHIVTAAFMDQFRRDAIYGSGIPRSGLTVSRDDEFDDESFSGWTKVWHGTAPVATEVEQDHSLSIHIANGGAAQQMTSYVKSKTISAGDWVSCAFSCFGPGGAFPNLGLVFSDGTTYGSGNQVHFHYSFNELLFVLRSTTGFDTQTAFNSVASMSYPLSNALHLKLVYQGSNSWDTYASPDGIQWSQIHTAHSMGSITPTHLGISMSSWGNTRALVSNWKYVRFNG